MEQYERAKELVADNKVFIPLTVILETEWVLRFAYEFTQEQISAAFRLFFGLENVRVQHLDIIKIALCWEKKGLDFADALHLAACQEASCFATFDRKLYKRAVDVNSCEIIKL